MNWKCLIKHSWVYSVEDIYDVRFCDNCHRKQRSMWNPNTMKYFGIALPDTDWVYLKLSKQNERDIKLKKLGI